MLKASDLKKGCVIEIDDQLYITRFIDVKNPSSRGASTLYKVRFSHVKTGQKFEKTFKGDDNLVDVELLKHPVQFLYQEEDRFIFMDSEDYNQYTFTEEQLEGQSQWLIENMAGLCALIVDEKAIAIELPPSMDLEIIDTAPAIKGASATSRTKTAKLSTGVEVQVPEYLATGELVRVNTSTGKFMSRA